MNSDFLLLLPMLLFSVVVHEVAHAWVALREGDDTAHALGRITLNPIPHLDLWGSLIIPMLLFYTSGLIFGWAKPVPVDPRKFRTPRASDIRVSLAGIVSNLALVAIFTLLAVVFGKLQLAFDGGAGALGILIRLCRFGVFINLILAIFNLIPVPPLDGSHVVFHLLPGSVALRYREMGRYGILVLMGVMILFPSVFRVVLWPVLVIMGLADSLIDLWI